MKTATEWKQFCMDKVQEEKRIKEIMKSAESKFMDNLLTKMFEIVGLKYTKDFTKQKRWYKKYTWNKKQEDEFKKFFIKEYIKYFKTNKKQAERDFIWFNFCYGWSRN